MAIYPLEFYRRAEENGGVVLSQCSKKEGDDTLYQLPLIRTRAPIGADQWT